MDEQEIERRLHKIEKEGSEYIKDQRLILSELKRLNDGLEKLDGRLDKLDLRLTKQEVKAGMWGALAGAATILVAIFLKLLWTGSVR